MKKYIYCLMGFAMAACFTACNEEDFTSREYYEYLVYMLSTQDAHNIYTVSHPYTDGEETLGYFSIGCGGSLSNPDPFTVVLEPDTILFNKYNTVNFDIDVAKYARLLSPSRYQINSMVIEFPANNKDQYVKVPIYVDPNGLSPDSTYFVPLAIKSVSGGYNINPEKFNILYRIAMENYYGEHVRNTFYSMRGNELIIDAKNDSTTQVITFGSESFKVLKDELGAPMVETRIIKPLSKNSVRLVAAKETVAKMESPTLAELTAKTIVLTIADDGSVRITPYGTIQVEQGNGLQLDGTPWNVYREERINMYDDTTYKYFYLQYRYRVRSASGTYGAWQYVQETLKKQE